MLLSHLLVEGRWGGVEGCAWVCLLLLCSSASLPTHAMPRASPGSSCWDGLPLLLVEVSTINSLILPLAWVEGGKGDSQEIRVPCLLQVHTHGPWPRLLAPRPAPLPKGGVSELRACAGSLGGQGLGFAGGTSKEKAQDTIWGSGNPMSDLGPLDLLHEKRQPELVSRALSGTLWTLKSSTSCVFLMVFERL